VLAKIKMNTWPNLGVSFGYNVRKHVRLNKNLLFCFALFFLCASFVSKATSYEPSSIIPPKPLREFRGVWVATVANIDWPSKPGLTTAEQKKELLTLLDRVVQLKLNAVIFQVRPACDAMYASKIEPWSEYLTGKMGQAPYPFYDPLAFAIEQAHARGLELHAWFNPYRAHHFQSISPISANHISKTRPNLVRHYGKYLWLDPGERDVQDYSLSVVMDVVKRYDVDGIHFDDYFYPYEEKGADGKDQDFPDDASWRKFGTGGRLSRDDWRRENVNQFVERVYKSIKAAKPWVKFGISPFGIWRPGSPQQIKGYDAYTKLFADSRLWLVNGWLDYLAPQLYWQIEPKEQSFPALLDWWTQQNPKGREIFSGIAASSAGKWKPDEIPNQIRLTRKQNGASGYILYSMKSLLSNPPLFQKLERDINAQPALVPATATQGINSSRPKVRISGVTSQRLWLSCSSTNASTTTMVLQTKTGGEWTTEIFHGQQISKTITGVLPETIAVTEFDRYGNASRPVVFERRK
jgi:uncharacterized lipoprotein YddW (UPF0748 family)